MRKLLFVLMVVICSSAAMAILPGDSGTGGNTGITDPDWNTGGPGSDPGIACFMARMCNQIAGEEIPESCKTTNNSACTECNNRQETTDTNTSTHVVQTTKWQYAARCSDYDGSYISCGCESEKTYRCEGNYYGNPDDGWNSTDCKACPANATCDGGKYFSCNDGYYMNATGTGCDMCPANATCDGGEDFSCNAGYYKNTAGTECVMCPNTSGNWKPVYSGTSDGDAESIKDCYISVGATFTDNIGTFEVVDENCYHN